MSWELVHLLTHPFPIVLALTGAAVGLVGWLGGTETLERWGIVSLLIAGAFAVPAYATGIAAADVVAERTFVRPSAVQTHRSWATWAAVGLVTAGIFAGFSLAQPRDRRLRRFVLLVGMAAAALTAYAASRGGRIAHPEETGAVPGSQAEQPLSPGTVGPG